jgi:hypothetical protein
MAKENIFTEFDLDASDPDSIEKMMKIARGEDPDDEDEYSFIIEEKSNEDIK